MSLTNIVNQVPYLRNTREFPEDTHDLVTEISKAYIDTANAVNDRTIGIYPETRPAITGNTYFITQNRKQQSLRQVYSFTTTANIPHGIPLSQIDRVINGYGSYTDGTNWYGVIFATSNVIANQLTFYLTTTDIVFIGAGFPALTKGTIVLEWLSLP